MAKRFLNVQYDGNNTEIDTKDMQRISQVQEKVKEKFELSRGSAYIELYDKDQTLITTWSQLSGLSEEYFQEENGLSLTIKLRPSPPTSRQPSDANLLVATGTVLAFYTGAHTSIDSNLNSLPNLQPSTLPITISSKRKFKVELEGLAEEEPQIVIPDIPMAYPYNEKIFFTRSCYKKLCVSVLKHFKEVKFPIITVTGTPGIGKSLFMQHFFKVLREEEGYKDKVFVLASFHDQGLRFALKYQSGEYVDLTSKEFEMSDRNYPSSIHIYDGSPTRIPGRCPMITFSSPNVKWFKHLAKINTNKKFFMETWTLVELQKAVKKLNLPINADDLKKSYHLFGGVARYCLSPSLDFRKEGERQLTTALSKINAVDDIRACLESEMDLNLVVHRLFHYTPDPGDNAQATLYFGSKRIADMIDAKIEKQGVFGRTELRKMLEGMPQARIFSGWLFEGDVHYRLSDGGNFIIKSLERDNEMQVNEITLKIEKTVGIYSKLTADKILKSVLKDVYLTPDACNFPGIDSCYYMENEKCLYLFQSTISMDHDVLAVGILRALEVQNLKNAFQSGQLKLRLVFVVKKDMVPNFRIQKIVSNIPPAFETMSLNDIPGIKAKKIIKLRSNGIYSVTDLMQCHKNANDISQNEIFRNAEAKKYSHCLQSVKNIADLAGGDKQLIDDLNAIVKIPQYVLGLT